MEYGVHVDVGVEVLENEINDILGGIAEITLVGLEDLRQGHGALVLLDGDLGIDDLADVLVHGLVQLFFGGAVELVHVLQEAGEVQADEVDARI